MERSFSRVMHVHFCAFLIQIFILYYSLFPICCSIQCCYLIPIELIHFDLEHSWLQTAVSLLKITLST